MQSWQLLEIRHRLAYQEVVTNTTPPLWELMLVYQHNMHTYTLHDQANHLHKQPTQVPTYPNPFLGQPTITQHKKPDLPFKPRKPYILRKSHSHIGSPK